MLHGKFASLLPVIALSLALILGACTGSGYSGGWTPTPHQSRAEEAPSRLVVPSGEVPGSVAGGIPESISGFEDPTDVENSSDIQYSRSTTAAPSGFDMLTRQNDRYAGYYAPGYDRGDMGRYEERQPQRAPEEPEGPSIKVGILLPLSGEKNELGQAMLNAAQMALFDIGSTNFELLPRDTKGTKAGAVQAAQSAIDDGAQLLLGPVFAASVEATKPVVRRYGLNMISFSTDWQLADNNTFIMGFLPFAQVQRISEYAARNNLKRIGIIAPEDTYGNVATRTFSEYARLNGLEITKVLKYKPGQKDLQPELRSFSDFDRRVALLDAQKQTLKQRLTANPGDQQTAQQLAELEKMTSLGDAPFDAVFMPMGGEQARTVAGILGYFDAGPAKVKRLGTGLWDDSSLARDPNLKGAVFAAPSPASRANFEKKYKQLYGQQPPRLSSLAYDATALAAVLARRNTGRNPFDRHMLINPNGFAGIDGIFRFRPDGLIERGLSVLEYQNGRIKEIETAPQTFQQYGM